MRDSNRSKPDPIGIRRIVFTGWTRGFTPARTVALRACLQSWEKDLIIELPDMLRVVIESAQKDSGRHLHFSGGSRFDDEFLIKVDPELKEELVRA